MSSSRDPPQPGTFCWLDLAASDAGLAQMFYVHVFGCFFSDQPVLGGRFTLCHVCSREVGSLYQLRQAQLKHGVLSQWTPYIAVARGDTLLQRVAASGGAVVVAPFDVPDLARIADAVGALVGLWPPICESRAANES